MKQWPHFPQVFLQIKFTEFAGAAWLGRKQRELAHNLLFLNATSCKELTKSCFSAEHKTDNRWNWEPCHGNCFLRRAVDAKELNMTCQVVFGWFFFFFVACILHKSPDHHSKIWIYSMNWFPVYWKFLRHLSKSVKYSEIYALILTIRKYLYSTMQISV